MNKLIVKLDRLFSIHIRSKDSKNGVVRCYTCATIDNWQNMDAGHYISRQYKAVRWDSRNVKPQCKSCNRFHEGMKDEFALHLVKDYGPQILEELNRAKWMIFKADELWLKDKIKEYDLSPL